MKNLKNEQGYALLVVLFVVTIFMILSLSFMGQAFSSTKQNQVVEKKSKATSVAEMGISYYQVALQDMYESKQNDVNTYVSSIMSQLNASTTKDFKREATVKMAEVLQSMIPVGTTPAAIAVEDQPNASFSIQNFIAAADPDTKSYKINISFNVIGNEGGKTAKLFAQMHLDLNTIINLPTTDDSNNYFLPTYSNILKPTTICTDIQTCKPVYVDGNAGFNGNNLLSNNLTVYTTGALTMTGTGNENNNSNINIHADGDLTIGKNLNSQTQMLLETNGNANLQQNVQIDTMSKLLVRLKLTVDQQLTVSNSSFVYVGEDATINKLTISSSKMCVHGNLYIDNSKTVDSSSSLLVLGKVFQKNNSNQYVEVTGEGNTNLDSFKKQCGTYVPPSFQINWGNNVSPIINNVDY